ncbi:MULTISPECIES: 16S rRNA (cytosine(1402)-N(4))-methyltransferase RsmH [Frigoribacterium]|uniref:16S rRNA (cytosine(1402)-N(4))-methyltransferase RsmH n=1 Tax=Frigoribacterium TaxID=96492 RepID=UPI0017860EF3|nr:MULTISPECIES: 16S rRNA (cytosine(1402)-N(4))-methyltransferase RsmH [Frigoribacterium]MBD8703600.1 16S rRNA (cytosine(1402)-N(4))-methyltransferase RsmH [Frigoribacterium sp. CFBP 13712]MCJ0700176.1 16S rRNA (cytosine(1402)-N(4))-methyltransferase RsmH [Frigoribacterium faeni]MDY0890891.1 16S rRNA (cytosine(1402)-N(4))-methyltransferase RsmH [Frigoribacterium sp. CFBP9030]
MAEQIHTPVLLDRTLELLAPSLGRPGAVAVDCTLGMGGHTEALLARFPELTVVGLDRDTQALEIAGDRLRPFGDRARLVHTTYDGIGDALDGLGIGTVDGVLFDLGVSSLQLDRVERGFSYSKDAPLDMRMDPTSEVTAETILAEYPESELRRIFYQYGEEKLAPRYARRIVEGRVDSPLTRSGELVDLLVAATPMALQRAGHPAKRVFQALRIEVNGELASLEAAVPVALDRLGESGRMVVLAYQSLEDRFVKRELAARTTSTAPQGLPVELPEHRPEFRLLVRGAELASAEEIDRNPRAKPVRLRAAERIRRSA